MKKCLVCDQTYTDDDLNFCLNDGGTLQKIGDDAPPTMFMNQPRVTVPNNWETAPPPANVWQQNSPVQSNQNFMASRLSAGQNQTLPLVSLVLGIFSIILFCCFGGLPLGIGAVVTGYLGMSNADKNPQIYGGRGLAIAGMVIGAISVVSSIIWLIAAALGKH